MKKTVSAVLVIFLLLSGCSTRRVVTRQPASIPAQAVTVQVGFFSRCCYYGDGNSNVIVRCWWGTIVVIQQDGDWNISTNRGGEASVSVTPASGFAEVKFIGLYGDRDVVMITRKAKEP